MPEILKKKPESVLLFLGDGEERENYEKKVSELNLEDKVIFTGNVRNVGSGMKDIHYSAKPRRAVRPEILSLIVDAKDKFQDVEDWAYAVFAMSTGMRKSEILAVKKERKIK